MKKHIFMQFAAGMLLTGAAFAQDDPILIGGALSLTGAQAAYDEPGYRGAQVAVKYINDNGGVLGRPLEFVNINGATDPVTVGNAAVELIDRGAEVIIAPCDFDFGSPAGRAAQEAGLVGISTCASDPLYGSFAVGDKQFTLSIWNNAKGAIAADYAFEERGWETAYVVTDVYIAYTQSLSRYFKDHYLAIGGEILLEDTYTNGDNTFAAQLARFQALEETPDVIFISSYGTDIGVIIRALREVGIDTPIVGGDTYDDPALHQALGTELGNDIFYLTHTFMEPEAHPDMETFISLYEDMFGSAPDTSFVATGWDTIILLAEAIEAAGTTEGEVLAQTITELDFDLLSGQLSYTSAAEGHAPQKSAALIELVGGEPQFLGWRLPEEVPAP